METTFENVRVGDKVWHVGLGWRTVVRTHSKYFSIGTDVLVDLNGIIETEDVQSVFWDEVDIVAPPRPKRMGQAWKVRYNTMDI